MQFNELIPPTLAELLASRGITEASPIQEQSLPHTFAGRDLIGRARTGTGKTLAFVLPIAVKLQEDATRGRGPRAIVLAPTRELAKQVAGEFEQTARHLKIVTVYGGAAYSPQENALARGVDIVVGTPGRVIDHLERGNLRLENVQFAVLDEADEMLSVGFADAIESILSATPQERQTLFFSATLPAGVERLAAQYLHNPITVDLVGERASQTAQTVTHLAVKVGRTRTRVLADLLTVYNPERAIVFTRTKREADELALELIHRGIEAEGLHGDLAQSQRERALGAFRSGRVRVLVATDVAARGLDIAEVDLVVQYHMPNDTEAYVHRSGRTGRAGREGTAIVLYGDREGRELRNLEHATGVRFQPRSVPTPKEVREASARTAADAVRHIETDLAESFREQAESLLNDLGVEALARALAKIAGVTTQAQSASLLSGEEGMTTVLLHAERMSVPRAVALLAQNLGVDSRSLGKIRLWRGGAVADVPAENVAKLLERSPLDGEVQVTIADELPELFEVAERDGRSRDGGRGYQGGRGGYGERRGGSRDGGGDGGSRPRGEYRPRSDSRSDNGERRSNYRARDRR
ncbi:DEAD/DEAH box helicase [Deinococcus yavapaiensis]|uniref:RNA helicase n=1 Tax=Deinococcus yavapaiensis KR-236 TaxID=694435 RepID=A0A318S0C4_9DEIO|nr:DEAD/DEAH box helicase [Deinococcus yavapaiensis]PYE48408.1 ATP-dependent RNA helicase DbpA [Deinococcus yavapaiensis KR-236]